MSITLDQLSPLLVQQFEEISKGWESHQITRNYQIKFYQIELENETIDVQVRMDKLKVYMPKTEVVCPDPLKFTASVVTFPLNKNVWEVIITHFKNQTRPSFHFRDRNVATFDSFELDGVQNPQDPSLCIILNEIRNRKT